MVTNRGQLWAFSSFAAVMICFGIGCRQEPSSPFAENPKFPDKEICSMACGSEWVTRTSPGLDISDDGYSPKSGDVIVWEITGDDTSFHGVWYDAKDPLNMEISINGQRIMLRKPEGDGNGIWRQYHEKELDQSPTVSKGDRIKVIVGYVKAGTVVRSLQPSGGH